MLLNAEGKARPLTRIAIVDESLELQYLYPEFVRWQRLFESAGIHTCICAPEALDCDVQGRLSHHGQPIDLLYNRLTDFSLSAPALTQIARAWQHQVTGAKTGSLITPHPAAHALWADKRNLDLLSDPQQLMALGLDAATVDVITACVPRTVLVDAASAAAASAAGSGRASTSTSGRSPAAPIRRTRRCSVAAAAAQRASADALAPAAAARDTSR